MEKREAGTGLRSASRTAFWLQHVEAWAASGETAAVYAKRHGLAVQSLYQAKHRQAKERSASGAKPPRFARVELRRDPAMLERAPALRMRLPSGIVLEWRRAPLASELAVLIAREPSLR